MGNRKEDHQGSGHQLLIREIPNAPGRCYYECTCGASWIGDC